MSMTKFSTVTSVTTRVAGIGLTGVLAMVYLPKIFALNSEIVFVAMPIALVVTVLALYTQIASLIKYIARNTEKN